MIKDTSTIRGDVKEFRRLIQINSKKILYDEYSSAIRLQVVNILESLTDIRYLLCYYPTKEELPLIPLYKDLINKYLLFFPVTGDTDIEFYQVRSLDNKSFASGRMGIMEPTDRSLKYNSANLKDASNTENKPFPDTAAIVPGLAFDSMSFGRIGYGGGYYDRFLADNSDIIKIGTCYEAQIYEKLPQNSWDVPMDYLVTEQRTIHNSH